ncbi:MAG TPA: nucleoside-diphosphate kinase [Myxococcota bacterium]|mgnify:CR=1 FL=1|nr:nucleoside-diphosphate kinase [Myxococcota bacterium]HQK50777.1 nucleoside-diphosphate kinase [Myxococcota bacterium]
MAIEWTFGMIKPDAVEAGRTGEILAMIERSGLRIVGLRRTRFTRSEAEAFYAVHRERPFYPSLCEFMSSGPIVVMVLEGENAIARWRDLMGPTDSTKAGPDTVRGRFGTDIGRNAVHGSDSPETAAQEIPFAFAARELI